MLLAPCLDIGASSAWTESGEDLKDGQFDSTTLSDSSIRLEEDPSCLTNWSAVQGGGPIDLEWQNMVYDPVDRLSILYGSGMYANCTWSYDSNLNKWYEMKPATNPWRRNGHAMAFDSKQGAALLSGGGPCAWENWLYNSSTNTWAPKANFTGNGRENHAVVYDERDGVFFLFGGYASQNGPFYYGDSLTLNISEDEWKIRRELNNPPGRAGHAMAYDKSRHLIILFGGYYHHSGNPGIQYQDTWIFNLSDDHWTNATPAISPQYYNGCRMIYDDQTRNCVLFGGNETWVYNATANLWTNRTTAFGPAFRTGESFAYDSDNGICILYGGRNGPARFGDTWTYDAAKNKWIQKDYRIRPGAYCGSRFVYDSKNEKVILFGGWFQNEQFDNTTWTFSPDTNTWQRMNPSIRPPARAFHSMVFDANNGVAVLFGGGDTHKTFRNDTWTYDYETDAWVDKGPVVSPPANRDWQMAYDSKRGLVFLFGVVSENGTDDCETWTYDVSLNVWNRMDPAVSPPRSGPMAYDSKRDLICLLDGVNGFWTYDPASDDWTLIHFGLNPPDISMNYMHYDGTNDSMILAGGGNDYYETWSYHPASNTYLELKHAINPPTSAGEGLAFDPDSGLLFMYGGAPPQSNQYSQTDKFWILGQPGYHPNGTYLSNIITSNGKSFYGKLDWTGNETMSTRIRFQLRSANSSDGLNATEFIGPDGSTRSYYTSSGQKICGIHDQTSLIQYRACLDTSNPVETPIIRSVAFNFNILHSIQINSPRGGENWSDMARITWSVLDPDNDSISVDIYLDNENSSTLIFGNLPGDSTNRSWNTNDTPNGTYRIRMVARDDNPSIPLKVEEVSKDFSIRHPPPPNHAPSVELVSPPNGSVVNSTWVRLAWRGIDADGDQLSFVVYCSDGPLESNYSNGKWTQDEHLDLENLTDGATYYWDVIPDDNRINDTKAPRSRWSFTVRLPPPPPANHPPKITSVPTRVLKVNETWTYRILASDGDGDSLSLSMFESPAGMVLDSQNWTLSWTPTAGQEGNHTITITVSDGEGGLDSQSFTLSVMESPLPPAALPICTIDRPANGAVVKGTLDIAGRAFSGSRPLTAVLFRVDGGAWQTAAGLANWSLTVDTRRLSNGPHTLEARAGDGLRFSNTTAVIIYVQNPPGGVTAGNQSCQPALILAAILGLVFAASLAFRHKRNRG